MQRVRAERGIVAERGRLLVEEMRDGLARLAPSGPAERHEMIERRPREDRRAVTDAIEHAALLQHAEVQHVVADGHAHARRAAGSSAGKMPKGRFWIGNGESAATGIKERMGTP